jgi:tetratricopeptide (TPR) repeat protein
MGRYFALLVFLLLAVPALASVAELRQRGLALREEQRWQEAIEVLERSVALAPHDVTGYIILGWTQHLAKHPHATHTLWQALKLNAWSVEAANALGIVYLVKGEVQTAILVHTWAALLQPHNEIAHYNLCLAYHRSGLWDWAIAHGERAMELEPLNPHPIVAVALVHWSSGNPDKALELYEKAIDLDSAYQTDAHLDHLLEAGFSREQVQETNEIRRRLYD